METGPERDISPKPRRDAWVWGEEREASGAHQQQGLEPCFLETPEDISGSWWK